MELKDNSNRARLVINVFWILIALNLVAVFSGLLQYDLITRIGESSNFSQEEANANDLRQGIIGILQTLVAIASIVTFISWFRRAYANLHRLGINYLEHEEQQAVWSWFIPFVNLVRPLKIMKEVWLETQEETKKKDSSFTVNESMLMVNLWWAAFLISNIIGNIAVRSVAKSDTIAEIKTSTIAYIASDSVEVFAAFFAILLIRKISEFEFDLYRLTRSGSSLNVEEGQLVVEG